MIPEIHLRNSPNWKDYELLDSGNGQKLERFGAFVFVRPEVQAVWSRSLPQGKWDSADASFQPTNEESGGHWICRRQIPASWEVGYPLELQPAASPDKVGGLKFTVMTTPGRHLGIFPECAANWDWMARSIAKFKDKQPPGAMPLNVLNLFGYTGLASLAAAAAGARVTHVDASKKSITWARQNQFLSGLESKPIRWMEDDALKFVQRESRRGVKYDGILLDPPKFGRGPKGEVWEVFKSLPELLAACKEILSDNPLFIIMTIYAVKFPAIHAYATLTEMMRDLHGKVECGELVTEEKSAGRLLSQAVFARWESI
jgi:23S rRNA (cytosine1962-C5)-methyltransferase